MREHFKVVVVLGKYRLSLSEVFVSKSCLIKDAWESKAVDLYKHRKMVL